jgi:hypothetical protein
LRRSHCPWPDRSGRNHNLRPIRYRICGYRHFSVVFFQGQTHAHFSILFFALRAKSSEICELSPSGLRLMPPCSGATSTRGWVKAQVSQSKIRPQLRWAFICRAHPANSSHFCIELTPFWLGREAGLELKPRYALFGPWKNPLPHWREPCTQPPLCAS